VVITPTTIVSILLPVFGVHGGLYVLIDAKTPACARR
jgi:hypothetical protein